MIDISKSLRPVRIVLREKRLVFSETSMMRYNLRFPKIQNKNVFANADGSSLQLIWKIAVVMVCIAL